MALFNSKGTYRNTQKSKLIQKLSLQCVDLQEPYVTLVDMGMIWRMTTPRAEDRQTQDGYKWSEYVHKVSFIILAPRIICVNDPTKDDKRDVRVQGKTHVPNTYMELADPFTCARAFKTLLCSISNKGGLQKLICSYLTDLALSVDAEIIYSVRSHCTNVSTQQPMQNYSFD